MKIKLVIAVLLAYCTSIFSMNPGGQLVDVSTKQYSIDLLKAKVASRLNGVNQEISYKIMECINKHTDKDKKTLWNGVIDDLRHFEKSQTLRKSAAALTFGTTVANVAWLAYPTVTRMSGAEDAQVCLVESMNQFVPAIEIMNLVQFACSLVVLFESIGQRGRACSTYHKHLLDLQHYIKDKDVVKFDDIKGFIEPQDFPSSNTYCSFFSNATRLAELPDGTIDIETFKKFLPRSYAMPDEIRKLIAFTFLLNSLPSMVCAPGLTMFSIVILGMALGMLNVTLGSIHALTNFPGSNRKNHTDIRAVINTIQDHLEKNRERNFADLV